MHTIKLPYGHKYIDFNISEEKLSGILYSQTDKFDSGDTEESIVKKSIENPIGSLRLRELARNTERVLIITSDHTRAVPSKLTMPILLEEIRKYNPSVKIKIIIATGLHRDTTHEELVNKFGQNIVDTEEIIIHNCKDKNNLVFKGILPSGGELWLNSLVDWADLLVAEGFIEPHFFAGYSGGRKSVLPGICGEKTVLANHCSKFVSHVDARTGNIENNPMHEDMLYAAKVAKLKFILNVSLNSDKKLIKCFCGDSEKAHKEGCEFVAKMLKVSAIPSEIVVVTNGGYPLDQNIYQTVKGMDTAAMNAKKGGVIIMLAECADGHGGEAFYRWFKDSKGPEDVANRIATIPMDKTSMDQWQAQIFAKILIKHKIILVTDQCDPQLVKDLCMEYASNIYEALEMAYRMTSPEAKVTVIPDGVSVLVEPNKLNSGLFV